MSPDIDPDTQINEAFTAGDLAEEFEGNEFQATNPERDHFECDFCSAGVKYSSKPRISSYIADDILNEHHPHADRLHNSQEIAVLASYCPDCTTRRLLFPCEGFAEARIMFDLDEDKTMHNVEVTDVSPRDDGIPWDPKEVTEEIMGIPFGTNELLADDHLWAPENIVTFFLATVGDVDIRDLIKFDGTLDPKVLGRARRRFEEFQKKMSQPGYSRKRFRDHVRDGE